MTKVCDVVLNNSMVTVAKFEEDHFIQFPAVKKPVKTVIVKRENDDYHIVDELEEDIEAEE